MVETVKLADEAPAGAVTVAGSDVTEELSEITTFAPPGGAGPASAMVHVLGVEPTTIAGEHAMAEITNGWMAMEEVAELPE